MKIKLILLSSIIILTVFLIYLTTLDRKVYFLALGDALALGTTPYGHVDDSYNEYIKNYLTEKNLLEKYIDGFIISDYRTTDLINDIENNKKINIDNKSQTIKNALIKADLVTLAIGMNDILYKINTSNLNNNEVYNHIDEIMNDMEKLFQLLKEYCKEDIIILNYYRPTIFLENEAIKNHFIYANNSLEILANKYKIHYLKIDNILENNNEFLPNPNKIFPSRSGYEKISDEIIKIIENNIIK